VALKSKNPSKPKPGDPIRATGGNETFVGEKKEKRETLGKRTKATSGNTGKWGPMSDSSERKNHEEGERVSRQ